MTDIDLQIRLQDYRTRVLNREPIKPAEYRELILSLQKGRESRAAAQAAERRAAKKPAAVREPVDLKALFS
jgi:hypothetical protein